MSEENRVTGVITLIPPLGVDEVADSRFLPDSMETRAFRNDVVFQIAEQVLPDVPGGFRRVVIAIKPFSEDRYSFNNLEDHLRAAVAEVSAGRRAGGTLIRWGRAQGDVERFQVRAKAEPDGHGGVRFTDYTIVRETAELRWPDGTPVGEV